MNISQYQRCECHECTQARWKMRVGTSHLPIADPSGLAEDYPLQVRQRLRTEDEISAEIRASIQKQLSNS